MNTIELPSPVSVRYDASDLRALNFVMWRRWVKIGLWVILVLVGLNIVMAIVDGASFSQAFGEIDWISLGIIPAVLGLAIIVSPIWSLRMRKKNGFDIPLVFTATHVQICIEHQQGRTDTNWSALRRAEVKRNRLYIFTTSSCAYILSRRCFDDQSAFDHWAAYATGAIANAKSVTVA